MREKASGVFLISYYKIASPIYIDLPSYVIYKDRDEESNIIGRKNESSIVELKISEWTQLSLLY